MLPRPKHVLAERSFEGIRSLELDPRHVDGTARAQTVTSDCGGFHDVIRAFMRKTECPVVMNTSLSGPGEPIVETPGDAVRIFLNSGLDAIYVDGVRITKS